jgi:hypothetical protein
MIVVAVPGRELVQQRPLAGVGHAVAQHRQQQAQRARAVGVCAVELQRLALRDIPLHVWRVAQPGSVDLLHPVGEVVITGHGDAVGRPGLVVGRYDITARRVLLLRVVGERVETRLGGLGFRCRRAGRSGSRRPGGCGSLAAAHQAMSPLALAHTMLRPGAWIWLVAMRALSQRVGAVEFIERVQDRVLGLQERPPHGYRSACRSCRG